MYVCVRTKVHGRVKANHDRARLLVRTGLPSSWLLLWVVDAASSGAIFSRLVSRAEYRRNMPVRRGEGNRGRSEL